MSSNHLPLIEAIAAERIADLHRAADDHRRARGSDAQPPRSTPGRRHRSWRPQSPETVEAVHDVALTGRELAVLRLLADGHTGFGIARRLGMAPRTVDKHLENAYRKLGVHDRLTAVRVAAGLGLVAFEATAVSKQAASQLRPRLPF
jgi:DNA-binding NarL/FixJ family response regulator